MVGAARPAAAINHLIAIDEFLASWQGDDTVQFVELRMLAAGQGSLSAVAGVRGAADLIFDDATASEGGRRVFTFVHDLARQDMDARILVATGAFTTLTGLTPDFVVDTGFLHAAGGRVCYYVSPPQSQSQSVAGIRDCVAYGDFTGDNGDFGNPTPLTPDDRSLQRVDVSGKNTQDYAGALQPTPERNDGHGFQLDTLCGNDQVNQGEQCDGTALGGNSCASLGFASGMLRCRQCHLDTRACSFCGNAAINGAEQCDGTDLGGRSCASLGFTGGTLACTDRCRLTTAGCDPSFFVQGGGPPVAAECLAEWRVTNTARRPGANGRAPTRQPCKDGDSGCDLDTVAGQCTFAIAVCFDRMDIRLPRGGAGCRAAAIESWTLLAPAADAVPALVAAVAGLGTTVGAVTFAPPLDSASRCTADVPVVVPTRGRRPGVLALRTRTTGAGGRPRDVDVLKLVCSP